MQRAKTKQANRRVRQNRIRARVKGSKERPRLCITRSNRFMSAQLIDDTLGRTVGSFSDTKLSAGDKKKSKMERAKLVGTGIAGLAKSKKISKVVFDRAGFRYAGRVQALADAARHAGLQF